MAKCPKCGADLKKGQKFCTKCGTKIKQKEYQELSPETEAKIDILNKKIKSDSLNTKLYLELGDIYRESKRLNEALSQYQKTINIDESNFEAHLKSGDVYFDLKELDKAKKSYLHALKLDEDSLEAKFGLFKIYYTLGEYENALDIGEELKEITPENIELYQKLSEIHIEIGQKEKALIELKQIKELSPDDISVLLEIGYLYQDKGDFKKSLNYFQEVLKQEPDNNEAYFKIGETFCIIEKYEETIKYLSDIINKLSPKKESIVRLYLTKAYFELNQKDEALDELAEAGSISESELKKFQKDIFADLYCKCGIELLENRQSIAIKYLKKSTQLDPQNQDYQNEYEKAIKDQRIAKQKSKKKIKSTLLTIFSILVIIILGWYLVHGKIFININPERASVFIDGVKVKNDVNHYTSSSLFLGAHKVRITKERYKDWEKKVKVGFGKTTKIDAELQPIYGGLKITSDPTGAEVYIDDDILLGHTPLQVNNILIGDHSLLISKNGFKKYFKKVNVEQSKKNNFVNVELVNIEGKWKGGAPSSLFQPINLDIKQKGNLIKVGFKLISAQIDPHGKIKKPYYIFWGNIKGEINDQKISANDTIYKKNESHWVESNTEKIDITLKGTISSDWNKIKGKIFIGQNKWNNKRKFSIKREKNKDI